MSYCIISNIKRIIYYYLTQSVSMWLLDTNTEISTTDISVDIYFILFYFIFNKFKYERKTRISLQIIFVFLTFKHDKQITNKSYFLLSCLRIKKKLTFYSIYFLLIFNTMANKKKLIYSILKEIISTAKLR